MRGFVVFLFGCLIILLAFGYSVVTEEINSYLILAGVIGAMMAGFTYHDFLIKVDAYFNPKSRD